VRLLLMRARFETYCPRIRRRGRIAFLFPSYVFVRLKANLHWYPIVWTPHVVRLIMAGERPANLSEGIVADLKRRERGGFVPLPRAARLQKGQQVRVISGSFEGHLGIYDGQTNRERERVLLEMLGRQVVAELPARDIVPVPTHKMLRV
jgi:transcription antitermination factor NusG